MASMDGLLRVRDLIDNFTPRIVAAGGTAGLDNVIESVTVSELEDPIPWMAPGSMLLTSGMLLRDEPEQGAHLIEHLHAAGKAGIGLAMAPYWTEVPGSMIDAADALQFPLLRLSGGLPFHVPLRWIYNAVSSRDLYSLQRTVSVQHSLAELLARDRSAEEIAGHVSDLVRAEVMLFDWHGGLQMHFGAGAHKRPRQDPALAWELYTSSRGAVPSPSVVRRDGLEVHMQEVRLHGGLEWVLMAVLPEQAHVTIPTERTMAFTRTLLEIQVLAQRSVIGRLRRARASLLDELLQGRRQASELSERMAHHGIVGLEPWRLLALAVGPLLPAVEAAPSSQAHLLRDEGMPLIDTYLESLGTHFLSGWQSDCLLVLVGMSMGDHSIDARQFALGLVQQVSHTLHLKHLRAGMSEPVVGVEWAVEAYTHARQALVSSATESGKEASVVLYEDLGLHYAALNALPPAHLVALRERFVQPLLAVDRSGDDGLYRTLLAFLAHNRSVISTAQALYMHRNTLARRLERIEHTLGITLRNTDDLTQLRLAISAADILSIREKLLLTSTPKSAGGAHRERETLSPDPPITPSQRA